MMNGLIGYGSSSEDEDSFPLPPVTTMGVSSSSLARECSITVNGTSTHKRSLSTSEDPMDSSASIQGPMVGPSVPHELTSLEYEEEDAEDTLPMPERDILRYLTQPSHPVNSLPPEPTGVADPAATARFKRFLELKSKGIHFNEDLAGKTSFKNPGLFASLLERADLSPQAQYSSTVPSNVLSLELFPDWAYKESLLRSQQTISNEIEATKKSHSSAGKRTIEFTSANGDKTVSRESTPGSLAKRKRT